ncbi:hypothetical protein QJQ45_000569 [Haematococcus lacustris]|nr:hypothetical protein QJQ45_000569 [Haematococcus lacustris]
MTTVARIPDDGLFSPVSTALAPTKINDAKLGAPTIRDIYPASVTSEESAAKPRQSHGATPTPAQSAATTPAGTGSWVTPEARAALFGTATEQISEVEAEVTGSIPAWLQGSLIMNGGGDYSGMEHLFDGLAMLTKIRIEGGRVWGSQRYLRSKQFMFKQKEGVLRWREMATPVRTKSLASKAVQLAGNMLSVVLKGEGFTDNACVNAIPLPDGNVMALSEVINSMYLVRSSDLSTLRQVQVQWKGVAGQVTTAHPKLLDGGHSLVNVSRTIPMGGFHVYKMDLHTLKRTELAFIGDHAPLAPSWVHEFGATQRHAIIIETPGTWNLAAMSLERMSDYVIFSWKPHLGCRIHCVALDGSGVKTFHAPPFFVIHHANAWEDSNGDIHADFAVFSDPEILNDLKLDRLRGYPGKDTPRSTLQRMVLPLGTSPHTVNLPMPTPLICEPDGYGSYCDFPAVAPAVSGREHRYVYCMGAVRPTNMGNALAKLDVQRGTSKMWHEPGGLAGEPHFLARPGSTAEDDGVVISIVMGPEGRSFLVVLDATSWQEVARAQLPFAVPYRFHGTFLPLLSSRS